MRSSINSSKKRARSPSPGLAPSRPKRARLGAREALLEPTLEPCLDTVPATCPINDDVPVELLITILGHLPLDTLLKAEGVCLRWQHVVRSCLREVDMSERWSVVRDTDFLGARRFRNLTTLNLARCHLLTGSTMRAGFDPIYYSNVSPRFEKLVELNVFATAFKSFRSLAALPALTTLVIGGNKMLQTASLAKLPVTLTSLTIAQCYGSVTDLAPLARLTNLRYLTLDRNLGFSIEGGRLPAALAPTLLSLRVRDQARFDVLSLAGFSELVRLDFEASSLEGAEDIQRFPLPSLRHLLMHHSRCPSRPLSGLQQLETLGIGRLAPVPERPSVFACLSTPCNVLRHVFLTASSACDIAAITSFAALPVLETLALAVSKTPQELFEFTWLISRALVCSCAPTLRRLTITQYVAVARDALDELRARGVVVRVAPHYSLQAWRDETPCSTAPCDATPCLL